MSSSVDCFANCPDSWKYLLVDYIVYLTNGNKISCSCRWQGIGVGPFRDGVKSNKFMAEAVLSGSEWTNAVKSNINYAPLRGVPGVGVDPSETPALVLGSCPQSLLLVTRRHHNVKQHLMNLLEETSLAMRATALTRREPQGLRT